MAIKQIKYFVFLIVGFNSLPLMGQNWEVSLEYQPGLSYTGIENPVYNEFASKTNYAYRYGLTSIFLFNSNFGFSAGGFITVPSYDQHYAPTPLDSILLINGEAAVNDFETVNISISYLTLPLRVVYQHNNLPVRLSVGLSYHTYLGSNESGEFLGYPWYNHSWMSAHTGIRFHFTISERVKLATGIEAEVPLADFMARNDGVVELNEGNKIWQFYVPVQLIIKINQ